MYRHYPTDKNYLLVVLYKLMHNGSNVQCVVGLGVIHIVGLGTCTPKSLIVSISAPIGPLTLAHGVGV